MSLCNMDVIVMSGPRQIEMYPITCTGTSLPACTRQLLPNLVLDSCEFPEINRSLLVGTVDAQMPSHAQLQFGKQDSPEAQTWRWT